MCSATRDARRATCALVSALIAGALSGCAIDPPETPTFETRLIVPLSEQRITIADLLEDVDGVVIDSSGVRIEVSGTVDSIGVDDELDVSASGTSFASAVGPFQLEDDLQTSAAFTLGELAPPGTVEGTGPLPAFSFSMPPRQAAAMDAFSAVTLSEGELALTITNGFPVPLGGACAPALRLRVLDPTSGMELLDWSPSTEIAPGATATTSADLAGRSLGSILEVEIVGCSPGSSGSPVAIDFSDAITIDLEIRNARAASATARLPAQTFTTTGTAPWGDGLALVGATIDTGGVSVHLTNETPLDATVHLVFLGFQRGGQPVDVDVPMAPGSVHDERIDLAGATFSSQDPVTTASYVVEVATLDTGASEVTLSEDDGVSADIGAVSLSLASLQGVLDPREETFGPVDETLEWPDEMEGLDPAAATLALDVSNGIGATAIGEVLVRASNGAETDSLTHAITIAPGTAGSPVETHVVIDETNSRILDLLALHPTTLTVEGRVTIGDGASVVDIERGARLDGTYMVTAPFAFSIQGVAIELDPKSVELETRVQEILREDVRAVTLTTRLSNGFPFGAEGSIQFAADSASVFSDPFLELPPLTAQAAEVDASSGKTVTATESRNEVMLDALDLETIAQDSLYVGVKVDLLPSQGVVVVSPEDEVIVESYLTIDLVVSDALVDEED